MTYQQVCEAIASFLNTFRPKGSEPLTGEMVWNISPSGEIWPIHALYDWRIARGMEPPRAA